VYASVDRAAAMLMRLLALFISICVVAPSRIVAHTQIAAMNGSTNIRERQAVVESPRSAIVVTMTLPSRFAVIRDVKLEDARPLPGDEAPVTILKFDVYNELDLSIADVVVAVSVLGPEAGTAPLSRDVVVRPFKIRLSQVLEPGFSVHYELRMKNLSATCDCVAMLEVLDARVVGETVDAAVPSHGD